MYPSPVSAPFLCIHGHFYQPPRENPWLDRIEVQDSAAPFHDWNQRITAECYAPMSAARILDGAGRIAAIVNLYSRISFNFGPTLLSWLERHAGETYAAILEADRESARRFGGHGSALAQPYNHTILPLAPRRDKVTQVRWGIADFQHRFRRQPEGMWLPETAVDVETLEVLAEEGIRFTVLAPHQARRVRPPGGPWHEVGGEGVDSRRPYLVRLPSGRSLALFFYHGPVARAVAFERLLSNGEAFLARLLAIADPAAGAPQLVHIATDGETYGHHHRFGEMALAWALAEAERRGVARLTNYGQYLELHPPTWEVELAERTSWSCAHGVERWRADCGCRLDGGTSQAWRAPLRHTLEWLRDSLDAAFAQQGGRLFPNPWAVRDAAVALSLDSDPDRQERFLLHHAGRPLSAAEQVQALQLLEMQRHAQLMFTSCGWFFDDIAGLEAVQVLLYAARAAQLLEALTGEQVAAQMEARLARAPSNQRQMGDGAGVWRRLVQPQVATLQQAGAQYAVVHLFDGAEGVPPALEILTTKENVQRAGRAILATGAMGVTARRTREAVELAFAVVHFGDHNVVGGVLPFPGEARWGELESSIRAAFRRADLPGVVRIIDRDMGRTATLADLPADDRRRALRSVIAAGVEDARAVYRTLYHAHAQLLNFIIDLGVPAPPELLTAASRTVEDAFAAELRRDPPDPQRLRELLRDAQRLGVDLDRPTYAYTLERTLENLVAAIAAAPGELAPLERLAGVLGFLPELPVRVNLWLVETRYHTLRQRLREGSWGSDDPAWRAAFAALGEALRFAPEG